MLENLTSAGKRLATTPEEFCFLLQVAAETLKENGIKFGKPVVSRTIPIIEYGKYQVFEPPYDVFNFAIETISSAPTIYGAEQEIADKITGKRDGVNYFCHFFPCVIRNTTGFIYCETGEMNILLFFTHIDDVNY